MIVYYLTHPQVAIDPDIPVPDWSLSEKGRERIRAVLGRPWLAAVRRIVSSEERKAVETAELIAASIGIKPEVQPGMGENDRSATGFIPPERFEAAADAFFAQPDRSWNGWERAVDAQSRIVAAAGRALNGGAVDSPVLMIGHGAVGTLLKCHVAGRPISRREDQPGGGGNVYAFDHDAHGDAHGGAGRLLSDWRPIETFAGVPDG